MWLTNAIFIYKIDVIRVGGVFLIGEEKKLDKYLLIKLNRRPKTCKRNNKTIVELTNKSV